MGWNETKSLLDSCHSLFVREIGEPEEGVFRVVLHEGILSGEAESLNLGGTTIENCYRVRSTDVSRVFELIWNKYIAYSVRNEEYAVADGEEAADSGLPVALLR